MTLLFEIADPFSLIDFDKRRRVLLKVLDT